MLATIPRQTELSLEVRPREHPVDLNNHELLSFPLSVNFRFSKWVIMIKKQWLKALNN